MTARLDVTVRDGYGDEYVLTYWRDGIAVAEAGACVAREAALYRAAHPQADVRESALTVVTATAS